MRTIWSQTMSQDNLNTNTPEEVRNTLLGRGYDNAILDSKSDEELDELIFSDDSFWQDDLATLEDQIIPMIENQCEYGIVIYNDNGYHMTEANTLSDELNITSVEEDDAGNIIINNNINLYKLPEDEGKLKDFVINYCRDSLDEYLDEDSHITLDDAAYNFIISLNTGDPIELLNSTFQVPEEDTEILNLIEPVHNGVEISESLTESLLLENLPKDLAAAFKLSGRKADTNANTPSSTYGNLFLGIYNRGNSDEVDWQASTVTQLTPEEALKEYKNGNGRDIWAIFGDDPKTAMAANMFTTPNGSPTYDVSIPSYYIPSRDMLKTANGSYVKSTNKLRPARFYKNATKIYKVERALKDPQVQQDRANGPMNRYNQRGVGRRVAEIRKYISRDRNKLGRALEKLVTASYEMGIINSSLADELLNMDVGAAADFFNKNYPSYYSAPRGGALHDLRGKVGDVHNYSSSLTYNTNRLRNLKQDRIDVIYADLLKNMRTSYEAARELLVEYKGADLRKAAVMRDQKSYLQNQDWYINYYKHNIDNYENRILDREKELRQLKNRLVKATQAAADVQNSDDYKKAVAEAAEYVAAFNDLLDQLPTNARQKYRDTFESLNESMPFVFANALKHSTPNENNRDAYDLRWQFRGNRQENHTDWENSKYIKLTPDEAFAEFKAGNGKNVYAIFTDDVLNTVDPEHTVTHADHQRHDYQLANAYLKPGSNNMNNKGWDFKARGYFTTKSGKRVDDSSKLFPSDLYRNADIIYKVIPAEKDADLLASRRDSGEFRLGQNFRNLRKNYLNYYHNAEKKYTDMKSKESDPSYRRSYWAWSSEDYLKEMQRIRNDYKEDKQKMLKEQQSYLEKELQNKIVRLKDLSNRINQAGRDMRKAKNHLQDTEDKILNTPTKLQDRINEITNEIKVFQRNIFECLDAMDSQEIQKQDILDKYAKRLADIDKQTQDTYDKLPQFIKDKMAKREAAKAAAGGTQNAGN